MDPGYGRSSSHQEHQTKVVHLHMQVRVALSKEWERESAFMAASGETKPRTVRFLLSMIGLQITDTGRRPVSMISKIPQCGIVRSSYIGSQYEWRDDAFFPEFMIKRDIN